MPAVETAAAGHHLLVYPGELLSRFWVMAGEIIVMITNFELHQINYFEDFLTIPHPLGNNRARPLFKT